MNRQLLILPAIGLLSALAGGLVFQAFQAETEVVSAPSAAKVSQLSFDDLSFPTIDGQARRLADWPNELLVVNFWAPWCAPCRREIPALIDIQQRHGEAVQVIGLAFDSADNVRDFAADYPFNYPLLLVQSDSAAINRYFGNNSGGLPFTVILDPSREIVFQHTGEITTDALDAAIRAATS